MQTNVLVINILMKFFFKRQLPPLKNRFLAMTNSSQGEEKNFAIDENKLIFNTCWRKHPRHGIIGDF